MDINFDGRTIMVNEKVAKNPKEVKAIVRNQTFMISAELSVADTGERGEYPLGIHSRFSRFPIAIINSDKKTTSANIPIEDMVNIIDFSKEIKRSLFKEKISGSTVANRKEETVATDSCYTTTLTAGKTPSGKSMKGRTPADVLLNEPDGEIALTNQWNWLNENLAKYPRNKDQMNAIALAINLNQKGELNSEVAKSSSAITLWEVNMRPLTRRRREDGKCFVYEASIKFIPGSDKYEVKMANYFAPVETRDNGTLNVIKSQAVDMRINTMDITADEWHEICRLCDVTISNFEMMQGCKMINLAESITRENLRVRTQEQKVCKMF